MSAVTNKYQSDLLHNGCRKGPTTSWGSDYYTNTRGTLGPAPWLNLVMMFKGTQLYNWFTQSIQKSIVSLEMNQTAPLLDMLFH